MLLLRLGPTTSASLKAELFAQRCKRHDVEGGAYGSVGTTGHERYIGPLPRICATSPLPTANAEKTKTWIVKFPSRRYCAHGQKNVKQTVTELTLL